MTLHRTALLTVTRAEVKKFVQEPSFGRKLCADGRRAALYIKVAKIALRAKRKKETDVTSAEWQLLGDDWLNCPVNLEPREERGGSFRCHADVYNYEGRPAGTLVVDFAAQYVGGGCFGGGFVQEEQLVAQSTDFATRLHRNREVIKENGAVTYEGMHIDAWWPRSAAAKKDMLGEEDISPVHSKPFTVLAVDAPHMGGRAGYTAGPLHMLARKIFLIFEVAEEFRSPLILCGLLGGGAFRNNRPLVLLLHLLLQPVGSERDLLFHHPIFWSFSMLEADELEHNVLVQADAWLTHLRNKGVQTIREVLDLVLAAELPLSQNDSDLMADLP